MNPRQLLRKLASGQLHNVDFSDFVRLVEAFGFQQQRSRGSHRIFARLDVPETLNLQPFRGQAKPYQIRQFLRLVEQHNLRLKE